MNINTAWEIAKNGDVSTPPDSIVLFSTSYQPTDANKKAALQYIADHKGCCTIGDTECGKQLIAHGFDVDYKNPDKELMEVWALASQRFIAAASGNIIAFVDNADPRSTFVKTELPLVLKNERLLYINGIDKYEFARRFISVD